MAIQINKTDREIFRLTWPNIVSNVSVPLISSVDTALMGSLSAQHLGAVGLGSMIFNFFYWNFGFLRMGTTGMTAQAFGAQSKSQISSVFYRSMIVAWCIALLLLLLQVPIAHLGIWAMNADDSLQDLIFTYVTTRIWAAPATLGLYVLFGWLFGMQNAKIPMWITIVINVANIVVSYYLIVYLEYGIFGVALGTVIAQYLGLFVTLGIIFWRKKEDLPWVGFKDVFEASAFAKFFRINKDIFIRTLCLTWAFGFFYSQSSSYGEALLGVNIVLLQFINWMSYGIDGFAFAAESVVGRWFGAKDPSRTHYTIKRVFLWSGVGAVFFSAIYGLFGNSLFRLFTDDAAILDAAQPYMWWIIVFPIIGFASYIWDGIYVGLTASKSMRNSMMISLVAYLAVYFLIQSWAGGHALWIALSVFLIVRAIAQHGLYLRYGLELE